MVRAGTNALHAKPSKAWLIERLETVASLRGALLPEKVAAYASALTGFSQRAIESACTHFEQEEPVDPKKPWFPPLPAMMEACRRGEIGAKNIQRAHCSNCDDMGMVVVQRESGGTCAKPCPACSAVSDLKARSAGE